LDLLIVTITKTYELDGLRSPQDLLNLWGRDGETRRSWLQSLGQPPERAARPRAEDQVSSLFAEPYDKPPSGAFVDMFI